MEKVPQRIGTSWRYKKIVEDKKSYGWHRHEEYEIAIHRHFTGHLFVGHNDVHIDQDHMVLLAPHLPHAIYSTEVTHHCETHVIWFKPLWFEQVASLCNELKPLQSLLESSQKGIKFSPKTAKSVVEILESVTSATPLEQLAKLLQIFQIMIDDHSACPVLLDIPQNPVADSQTLVKLQRIDQFLLQHYRKPIQLKDIAEHLFTSESSVRRLFAKHYNESFSTHLQKLRLNIACDLLLNTDLPISIVMENSGYLNQANFNRQFKRYKRTSPLDYREKLKSFVK